MTTKNRNRLLTAVAAALPMLAIGMPTSAQTRVNQDGRALDANTRVGGDGSNDRNNGPDRRDQTYTGNQVVTGNVSGSKAFRGPRNYRDPFEFTGPVAGLSTDRFVRDSSGAPTRTNPNVDYGNNPTAFYGDARNTPVPVGFRADGFSGGYFNTGVSQTTLSARDNPSYGSLSTIFDTQNAMLRPGTQTIDAGLDDNKQQTVLSASPLYGVLKVDANMLGQGGQNSSLMRPTTANPTAVDRAGYTPADYDRMRKELNDSSKPGDQDNNPDNTAQPADPNNLARPLAAQTVGGTPGAVQGESVQSGRGAAVAARNLATGQTPTVPQPGNVIDGQVKADRLDGRSLQTSQSLDRQINVPPAKQSKLYAELQQRYDQERANGATDSQDSQQQLRLLRTAQAADAAGANANANAAPDGKPKSILPIIGRNGAVGSRPGDATKPAATAKPGAVAKPEVTTPAPAAEPADKPAALAPGAAKPEPVRIKSLAEGVQAKGLHDVLASAEDLMHAGKFTSAIEKYDAAGRVAPNNPLILLGRAQAELGATRYGSAEQHLRDAVAADPALLMGQYDLESFFGRDRLSFVVQDLKQVASNEVKSARPMILLAYIAYGMPDQGSVAADYLGQAAQRAGKSDTLITQMQKTWKLPEKAGVPADTAPKPELNK